MRLQLPDDFIYAGAGKIDFADVTVDRTTDTLTVRAVFPNKDRVLVDGQYVRVRIERFTTTSAPGPAAFNHERSDGSDALRGRCGIQGSDLEFEIGRDAWPRHVVVKDGLAIGHRLDRSTGFNRSGPGIAVDAAPAPPGPG